jgi:glycosyltransferase involved in cell wall biosynthesis
MMAEKTANSANRDAGDARLACVVPMHNEAEHIHELIEALYQKTSQLFKEVIIIAVDDGSQDQTAHQIAELLDHRPIQLIRFSRNFGKEAALTAGLDAALTLPDQPDAVLTIDADFQHPLPVIDELVAGWSQGHNMVYGVQQRSNKEGLLKRLFTCIFYRLLTAHGDRFRIPPDAGDFRLMDQRVVSALAQLPERNRFMKGLYAWVGFSTVGVPFEPAPRAAGVSTFSTGRLISLALDGITAFTAWPLRLAAFMGVIISMAALGYGIWIIFEWLWIGQPIPGFATLASALMFFSGVQLMSIGLLGEYIGRVFAEVKGRPVYIINEQLTGKGFKKPDPW